MKAFDCHLVVRNILVHHPAVGVGSFIFALFASGTRCVESERPFNDQEKAEGPAEGSGEAGETERKEREGGPA